MPVLSPYPGSGFESTCLHPVTPSLFDLLHWRPCICRGQSVPSYEVSENGDIRRCLPPKKKGKGIIGKNLSRVITKGGYVQHTLCINGKRLSVPTHHFVAEAFIGPRPPGAHINHKDGNKANNHVSNLEYCTPQENIQHAWQTGLMPPHGVRGEKHPLHKLTSSQVLEIRRALERKEATASDLARRFEVSHDLIRSVRDRKCWKHI